MPEPPPVTTASFPVNESIAMMVACCVIARQRDWPKCCRFWPGGPRRAGR
jgi:hypothetical protein